MHAVCEHAISVPLMRGAHNPRFLPLTPTTGASFREGKEGREVSETSLPSLPLTPTTGATQWGMEAPSSGPLRRFAGIRGIAG